MLAFGVLAISYGQNLRSSPVLITDLKCLYNTHLYICACTCVVCRYVCIYIYTHTNVWLDIHVHIGTEHQINNNSQS